MSGLTHLLLDLENVQPSADELKLVRGAHFRLYILHGPHQKHFTADLVKAWQPLGTQVRFVQSTKTGHNALDLHVAFSLGEACEQDRQNGSNGCFVIVSGDKDFDALFGYLQGQGIRVGRSETLTDALRCVDGLRGGAVSKAAAAKPTPSANAARLIKDFKAHPRTRPSTEKRLRNQLASFLAMPSGDPEVDRVIAELKALGVLSLAGSRISYSLPTKGAVG